MCFFIVCSMVMRIFFREINYRLIIIHLKEICLLIISVKFNESYKLNSFRSIIITNAKPWGF